MLVYPIISISGHCHSCSRTALIPELPAKGTGSLFGKGCCTPLPPPALLSCCPEMAAPSGTAQWAWAWQSLGGVLFSVGDKKEWGQWHLFPTFSGKARDCSNWYKPQEGWVSLGICGLLGITCVTASMGVLFRIFCFPLFLSVIGHPLLVERQWAVTDDIRNEPQCHPPPSPLPFNELCVPRAGLLSQESTAAPALSLRLQ